jgi:hypothetical protein
MERIKLVQEQLKRIEGAYLTFFKETNTSITDYVRIMPNSTNTWLNVTVRNEPELLPEIKSQIEKTFRIVK